MIKQWVEVSFQKEGIHLYPQALTDPKLADVSFLGHPHRHIFHFYAKLEVFHDDREVEFILLKRELELLYPTLDNMGRKSCEMLAMEVLVYLQTNYPGRDIVTRVYEDNENGAIVEYTKE